MRPLRLDDRGFCSPIRLRKNYVSVLKKIQKAKRGCNATRTFRKNRKARKTGLVLSGRLYWDTNEDFWTMFNDEQKSYLSKCVTSITLCNGESTLFSCSGIAIDQRNHLTRFLTSASLVRALNGATNKDYIVLKIAVRHEGNEVYEGRLAEYDLDQNFAIVNVYAFLDVHVGLKHVLDIPSHGELLLVALGRGISGKLIARTVMSSCDLRVSEDDEVLACENSEPWEGGPLFSRDGIFVGMSLHSTMRRAFFRPWNTIFEHLKQQATLVSLKLFRFGPRPLGEKSSSHQEVYKRLNQEQLELDSMGYPKLPPTMSDAGMVLVHTFEETFGDIYGEGVWSKLSKKASSDLNCSIVALASYNGEKRLLACTGFFIEWNGSTVILTSASLVRSSGDENKIVENLRIEVLLPHNRCIKGKLEDYCLHYNVAVVSVKDHHDCRPANVLVHWPSSCEVAAVGRCFKTGALMATTGKLVPWSGTLDCEFLIHSSCKITKAGIGGPLATMDGDVIGMNFYDRRVGTPFLSWECICNILRSLKGKSKEGEVGNDSDSVMYGRDSVMYGHTYTRRRRAQRTPTSLTDSFGAPFCKMAAADKDRLNRWPVPMPYWCHRDYMDGDKSDDDDDGCEYTYLNGEKFMLF